MIKNLLIDSDIFSFIRNDELDSVRKMEKEFIDSWARKNPEISDKAWLHKELTIHLPEETPERIKEYTDEIVSTVKINAEKRQSLDNAISQGRSKEDWFAKEVGSATKDLGQVKTCEYLKDLDSARDTSNENLYNSILTDNAVVNKILSYYTISSNSGAFGSTANLVMFSETLPIKPENIGPGFFLANY